LTIPPTPPAVDLEVSAAATALAVPGAAGVVLCDAAARLGLVAADAELEPAADAATA